MVPPQMSSIHDADAQVVVSVAYIIKHPDGIAYVKQLEYVVYINNNNGSIHLKHSHDGIQCINIHVALWLW
jgi:hypothetical protein